MTDFALLMIYMGVFTVLCMIATFALLVITFIFYKRDKGKLSFRQFAKRWKA